MTKPFNFGEEKEEMTDKTLLLPRGGLHLVKGGKDDGDGNWLSPLPEGTIFLSRHRNPRDPHSGMPLKDHPILEEYHVIQQTKKATLLFTNLMQETRLWVDPVLFCIRSELIEVLTTNQEEVIDGGSD